VCRGEGCLRPAIFHSCRCSDPALSSERCNESVANLGRVNLYPSMPSSDGQSLELRPSEDGYLRLTLGAFRAVTLRHIFSDLNLDMAPTECPTAACETTIAGFTEWASNTRAAVSVGWDWRLDTSAARPRYRREGEVRSNVMLVAPGFGDMGSAATCAVLSAVVDRLLWEAEACRDIIDRYAWRCQT
jgi:hypothetical protein